MPARYFNFFIFIFLLIGIVLGGKASSFLFFTFLFILSAFLVYFSAFLRKQFLSDAAIFVLIVSLGALIFLSSRAAEKDRFLEGRPEFTIKVISFPQEAYNRNVFLANVLSVNGSRQNIRLRVFDYAKQMEYLNKYRFSANLAKRIHRGRSYYNLWVRKDTHIEKLPLSFWEKLVKKVNYYCLEVFDKNCDSAAKNFLAAIFLGRRELMGREQIFMQKAGLAHLLAISGLHIGLISLILFYFLRFFNLDFRTSLLLSCVFLVFYAFVAGLRPSIQRAVIMYLIFAFGFFLKRKPDVLNSLGLAGIILLLFSPSLVYDVGFQLSFLAVFGIIVGFKILPYKSHSNFFLDYTKQIFLCSFFVFMFIMPLVSYYFGRIHFFSAFYNVILIPFFALILFFNFLLVIISPFAFLAQGLGAVLSWIIYFFQNLTRFLGSLPISYFSYSFSLKGLVIYYLLLFTALTTFLGLRRKRKQTFIASSEYKQGG